MTMIVMAMVLIMSNHMAFVGLRTPIPFISFSSWNPDYLHSAKRWIWSWRSSVVPDYLHSSKRWSNQDDHDDHDDHRQPQIIYTHPSQREICGFATGSVLRCAPVTNRSFLNNLRAFSIIVIIVIIIFTPWQNPARLSQIGAFYEFMCFCINYIISINISIIIVIISIIPSSSASPLFFMRAIFIVLPILNRGGGTLWWGVCPH